MAEAVTVTADRGDSGQRIDRVLCRHLAEIRGATRTRVQAWIADGRVRLNGSAITRAAARTSAGDVISVAIPEDHAAEHALPTAEDVAVDVLYEDEDLLAVDKAPGIVMHPSYKNATGTLMNALLWRAQTWKAGQRPSLVGRLDKLTSGVVLVAKTPAAHAALQRSRGVEKDYLAVVYGRVTAARGRIDLRLSRAHDDRRRVVASAFGGLESVTYFERLARVAAPRAGLSLLRCRLGTGRMHQIRVHLAARGWPIVGDAIYGEPRWSRVSDASLAATLRAFPRQALHAWRVAFTHPMTRERVSIEAPIPFDLADLLVRVGLPRNLDSRGPRP